jgi:hypothetical protein
MKTVEPTSARSIPAESKAQDDSWVKEELKALKSQVDAGYVADWNTTLSDLRDRADTSNDWTPACDAMAHDIALRAMEQDFLRIDAATDARVEQKSIEIAHYHNRTAVAYGVTLFSDRFQRLQEHNDFSLAQQNWEEGDSHATNARAAILDLDSKTALTETGQLADSRLEALGNLRKGIRLSYVSENTSPKDRTWIQRGLDGYFGFGIFN